MQFVTKDEMNIVCSFQNIQEQNPVRIKNMSATDRTKARLLLQDYAKRSLFQYDAPCKDTGKTIGEMIDILERANNQSALLTPNYNSDN
jgi:hypothetical protein